jgi:sigma-B regulation protein RsbU (phosphoserine phosphatase)
LSNTCSHAKCDLLPQAAEHNDLNQAFIRSVERGAIFQQGLLPSDLSVTEGVKFASTYIPRLKVSGDFFTVRKIDEDRVFIMVSDASGSGVIGALLSVMFVGILTSYETRWHEPARLLQTLNRDLCKNLADGLHVTAFCGVLSVSTGMFAFANAGHPFPLHFRKGIGKAEPLKQENFFLGMMPDATYEEQRVLLESGDRLLFYTDGLTQNECACGTEPLDVTALGSELSKCKDRRIEEVPEEICRKALSLTCNSFKDDVIVLALEVE